MVFISTRDRSRAGKGRLRRALCRQKDLNKLEKAASSNALQDVQQTLTTHNGNQYTMQQLICGLTDQNGYKIFTGVERLGESGRALFTFDGIVENTARETITNIIPTLSSLVNNSETGKIADESKRASIETQERHLTALNKYMEDVEATWFDASKDGSMSSLSGFFSDSRSNSAKSVSSKATTITLTQ